MLWAKHFPEGERAISLVPDEAGRVTLSASVVSDLFAQAGWSAQTNRRKLANPIGPEGCTDE